MAIFTNLTQRCKQIGITASLLAWSCCAPAGAEDIDRVGFQADNYFKQAAVGVYAVNLNTNQVLLSYNGDQLFKPASTLKVLTALNAATTFGWDYRFTTTAYANGTISNGKLNGDLIFHFVGDPSLTQTNLRSLVSQVANKVSSVTGQVLVNVGNYTGHDRPIGWNWANNSACYSSVNSAAQINYNCVQATLDTNQSVGKNATVKHNSPVITITASATIVPTDRSKFCTLDYVPTSSLSFDIAGCSAKKAAQWINFAVPDGNQYVSALVYDELKRAGVTVNSIAVDPNFIANYGDQLQPLGSIQGQTIAQLVQTMLTNSENHIAEQLFRTSAFELLQTPINYDIARDYARQKLEVYGLDINYQNVDGSGLSYSNNISPEDMTKLMAYIYRNDKTLNLWSKFPNQKQGTLAAHRGLSGFNVKGKTGSISGAHNFTGIVFNKSNEPIAFTYFVNNYHNGGASAIQQKFEKDLLTALTK